MNKIIHTPPESDDESLDGLNNSGVTFSTKDLLNRLWRFFISMRTGLALLLGLGVMSLIGTLVVQAPPGVRSNPEAYVSWLDTMRPKYGGWTTVLDTLGLFSAFSSIWFLGINILLTTSILACTVNRAPLLWRLAVRPRIRMRESFFKHATLRAELLVPAEPEKAIEEIGKVFKSHRFRLIADPADGLNLYADRNRWGPFGTPIAHLSFAIIILGVLLSVTTGFNDSQFAVTVGSKAPVGHGTGLTVEAKSFSISYYPDGSAKEYASDLVLYKNGIEVLAKRTRVNHPMKWDRISFYQAFYGVSAMMTVKDEAGKTLFNEGVPLVWSSKDRTHVIGLFTIKEKAISVYVVNSASGKVDPNIKAGQMQLEIHQTGTETPIATQVVSQGKPTKIAGLEYTFQRTRQFTGLIVARDPGTAFVWVGSALLMFGIYLVFFFPHRRIWVRIRRTDGGSEILCASTMRRDAAFKPQFHQIVSEIQLAGTPASTTER